MISKGLKFQSECGQGRFNFNHYCRILTPAIILHLAMIYEQDTY